MWTNETLSYGPPALETFEGAYRKEFPVPGKAHYNPTERRFEIYPMELEAQENMEQLMGFLDPLFQARKKQDWGPAFKRFARMIFDPVGEINDPTTDTGGPEAGNPHPDGR